MKLYYINALDDASIVGSTAKSGFPWINVQHPHLSKVVRTISTTSQYVLFDAGVGNKISADMCAILAHNLTVLATVTFKMNDVDDWTTSPVSVVLDPAEEMPL